MGRLETDWLATDDNLAALTDLTGVWIDRVHKRKPPKMTVLDMDSSVSPAYGDQEGSAHSGHRLHLLPSAIPVQPPQKKRNFYNLVLHPVHDRFEQNQFGLTPRGSILEWIDAFYEYSKSDLDRTAGKLTNVERIVTNLDELLLDPNLKGNVNLHVFGLRTGGPTKHGEFSEIVVPEDNEYVIVPVTFKYWLLMFWRENYKKIDDCRSRNTQLFVKRERDSDQRIFFSCRWRRTNRTR